MGTSAPNQARSLLWGLGLACSTGWAGAGQPWDDGAVPDVLTVTRLRQGAADAPASVTVLDREFIRSTGVRTIPEVLRFVPGMSVGSRDGYNHVVSYHGTNFIDSRRMQVLVDGRSVYSTGLANVNWMDLPLALEDIERIEVTRGPSASTYGANAFLGVINIITRHPQDAAGLAIASRHGEGNVEDYQLRHGGGSDTVQWRATLASRHDDGFHRKEDGITPRRDSTDQWFANARLTLTPRADWSIDLQGGYKHGGYTEDLFDDSMASYPDFDTRMQFLSATLEKTFSAQHALRTQVYYQKERIEQDWISCMPPILLSDNLGALYRSNPGYTEAFLDGDNPIGSGGSAADDALALAVLTEYFTLGGDAAAPRCGQANQDTTQARYHLEVQDTLALSDTLRLVTGASLRRDIQDSETYLAGKVAEDSAQLFAHIEYRFAEHWLLNLGGLYEDEESADNTFAPRAALNWQFMPGQTVRIAYSQAYRTPDIFENDANWSYTLRGLHLAPDGSHTARFFPSAQSPGGLDNERIVSQELGYLGHFPQLGLQVDIKLFHDHLDKLITQGMSLQNFSPNNQASVTHDGVEATLSYRPSRNLYLRATYAYIDADTDIWSWREISFTPEHAASLYGLLRLPGSWDVSATYYYSDNINFKHFSRADLRIAKTLRSGSTECELAAIVQHRLDDNGDIFNDNTYQDDTRVSLQAELRF